MWTGMAVSRGGSVTIIIIVCCVVVTGALYEINFSQLTDEHGIQPHLRMKRSATKRFRFVLEIDVNVSSLGVANNLKYVVGNFSSPLLVQSNNITDIDVSTVCQPNNTGYQCTCEEDYFLFYKTCVTYGACSNIINQTCGCINSLPFSVPLCQKDVCGQSEVCGPNSNCTNVLGGHTCSCLPGYNFTDSTCEIGQSNPCLDINKCLQTPSVCGPNSVCNNTIGDYSCSCLSGYIVNDPSVQSSANNPCTDIPEHECDDIPNVCGPNSNCINTNGSFNCSCLSGYRGTNVNHTISNSNQCTDVDECLQSSSICGPNSVCNNTGGGYNCTCQSGYQVINTSLLSSADNPCTELLYFKIEFDLNATSGIVDQLRNIVNGLSLSVDDLSEITDTYITTVCSPNGTSYQCQCESEFYWSCDKCQTYGHCDDIVNNTCGCINAIPDDRQYCQPKTNFSDCPDVDECLQTPSICGPNSVCNNTVGDYSCTCRNKYQVSNISQRISESNPCIELLYFKIEFDLNATSGIVDQLRNIVNGLSLSVDDLSEITTTYITTVCSPNGTSYQCQCESEFYWSCDKCQTYGHCDDIVNNTCGCINAIPDDRQLQRLSR
ncbi:uncharacterized protein LOC143109199 [Alosa pseudoharengus]|uniref:uncharacterized protein LOC143109199 n=1 Tax=Alosa pseudoharengus TaxID=34774 RepID=UPI003F895FAE